MEFNLQSFIKYCQGYLALTQSSGYKNSGGMSLELDKKYFNLLNLLNGDNDGNIKEVVNLSVYYDNYPKSIPTDLKELYSSEKSLALNLDSILNKTKNDSYTKELVLRFGKFDFEVLKEKQIKEEDFDNDEDEKVKTLFNPDNEDNLLVKKTFHLFNIPVQIIKEDEKVKDDEKISKYFILPLDNVIRLNLQPIFEIFNTYNKPELAYEFLQTFTEIENDSQVSIPMSDLKVFKDLWQSLVSKLKLTDANFDENSFDLNSIILNLAGRSNFFLTEDLMNLSRLDIEHLDNSSISAWTSTEGFSQDTEPSEEKDLYFPFKYDKYQRSTTSILNNKASIIEGPPGTGKSETISNIICHLAVNNKKILFVSQKPQALRVVKNKLKTLEIPLLYGYIPSNNIDASLEEEDTISSHLANIGDYLTASNLDYSTKENLDSVIEDKLSFQNKFQEILEKEKEIFSLNQELMTMKDLSFIDLMSVEGIISSYTNSFHDNYWKISEEIKILSNYIDNFNKNDLNNNVDNEILRLYPCALRIKNIIDDIKKTGYDGGIFKSKFINQLSRKVRLNSTLVSIPREIRDLIDSAIKNSSSKHSTVLNLQNIYETCNYFEVREYIEYLKEKLSELENNSGLTNKDMSDIRNFIEIREIKPDQFSQSIDYYNNLKKKIKQITGNIVFLKSSVKKIDFNESRKKVIAGYLKNIVTNNIKSVVSNIVIQRTLNNIQKIFKKSKKAFKTFDNFKKEENAFETVMKVVPIWIMDLESASRLIPLKQNLFDYVILDEASQCNIAYTLPAMYRASKTIFVGDPEQMKDTTISFKSNSSFEQLAKRYKVPEYLQIKPSQSSVQSVLDMGKLRFGVPKILKYHYRSPSELIGFSNENFYEPKGKKLISLNNKYLTYKDTNKIMLIHQVVRSESDISDRTNVQEALKALEIYKNILEEKNLKDKSVAILTFFNDQADLIRKVFEDDGYKENDDLKISIIEGIQGDEKDIVIYSFVIDNVQQKNRYIALTGESGDIRADINAGRVNVAFSRARLQVHCIVSMNISDFPGGIWIKKYLQYVNDNGELSQSNNRPNTFDSYFEEEFYFYMKKYLGKEYIINNQVSSCGFKIDFTVTNTKTNQSLAIECDGPMHFKDSIDENYGINIESDIERQNILESAGWRFYRVGYSSWISGDEGDKTSLINVIKGLV